MFAVDRTAVTRAETIGTLVIVLVVLAVLLFSGGLDWSAR